MLVAAWCIIEFPLTTAQWLCRASADRALAVGTSNAGLPLPLHAPRAECGWGARRGGALGGGGGATRGGIVAGRCESRGQSREHRCRASTAVTPLVCVLATPQW